MQTLKPVLWIWPWTAALLLLNQPQLTKLHSFGFEDMEKMHRFLNRPSLEEEIENFGSFAVITYYSECVSYVNNTIVIGVELGFCHVFYEGQVKGFKREGNGEMNYADGSVYSGQWRDDKREGYGRMYYASGFVYEGEWVSDKRHGQGVITWANYDRYLSDFIVHL